MKTNTKAHLAVLGANLIFGANYSLIKFITPSLILPLALNVVRIVVSVVMFWGLFLINPTKPGIQKKHLLRFLICAATGVAINQVLFVQGLSFTTSIHASLLMLCTPILITLFAAWILKERITLVKTLGLALGIGGAVMLVLRQNGSAEASNVLWGDLLIIINAISYAFYLVMVKPLMEAYSPIHVLRWVFTLGALLIIPFGWNECTQIKWELFEVADMLALGFIVIGSTFFAYLFNIFGVQYLGASITGSYIYLQPFFASLIAVIFLHESLTMYMIVSAILIFSGVYLAAFRKVR